MQKKQAVKQVVGMGLCGRARACRVLDLNRATWYRAGSVNADRLSQEGLVAEVSRAHPCWGYRKVTAVLRHEHEETINAKRVARLRRRDGLQAARKKHKRQRLKRDEAVRRSASKPDEVWSYDFVEDALVDGRKLRILSIIDEYTREALVLRVARSFPARRVIDVLEEVMVCTGRVPTHLRSDNGPEFVARTVRGWLEQAGVGPIYITPGSPWENGHVESFHASLRAELLDRELFFDYSESQAMLEDWRQTYNEKRPHGALGYRSPRQAAREASAAPCPLRGPLAARGPGCAPASRAAQQTSLSPRATPFGLA